MNHFKQIFAALLVAALCTAGNAVAAQTMKLTIIEGISNTKVRTAIENNVSALFTRLNQAQTANAYAIGYSGIGITQSAQLSINRLWENEHFRCQDEEVVEVGITTRSGYQVRNIPVVVFPKDKEANQGYQEVVINFDKKGNITTFNYAINPELYSNLVKKYTQNKNYEVTDIDERMQIINFVEQFRTSYNQKDMKFLRQIFSDDALIITGHVVKPKLRDVEIRPQVVYKKQTKGEYLSNLQMAFNLSKYIKVQFDELTIVNHPTKKGIYGVTVKQQWNTNRYSDEGYVFMIWDFKNPKKPVIHVRTWQPTYLDNEKKQKSTEKVFDLSDFEL